jgi:glycerol-3-phosphate dehydrogenase
VLSSRGAVLDRLANEAFDLLVVGGGATGAAVARDAALRGLAVAMCESGDFAGQTSSRSSKLIHGGLRYLQYGDLGLVLEGLSERRRLMTIAPHLCRPVEFLFPAYRTERPGLTMLGIGIALYNTLALWRAPVRSRRLSSEEVQAISPSLRSAGLEGAQLYVDCQTNDARLVLETALDAELAGAAVAPRLHVVELVRERGGRARAATVVDRESGETLIVRARAIVNATGPFSDAFDRGRHNLRATLGVHLVFDAARLPIDGRAVVLRSPRDGRLFFALPAGARTIIGTTDTDWSPAPGLSRAPRVDDEIRARRWDVDYLLEAANHAFPTARLLPDDVISTFAGLRPLVATPAHTPSSTSREHDIVVERDGLITVVGGKLTTMRLMGEEVVDKVVELLRERGDERTASPCLTRERPLPGAASPLPALAGCELASDVEEHLLATYGARAAAVGALITESPELARRIDGELPYLWAEVVHSARHEHVCDVEDVFSRRIPLFRDARDQGLGAADRAADLIGRVLGWTASRRARSVQAYQAAVGTSRRWRSDPEQVCPSPA